MGGGLSPWNTERRSGARGAEDDGEEAWSVARSMRRARRACGGGGRFYSGGDFVWMREKMGSILQDLGPQKNLPGGRLSRPGIGAACAPRARPPAGVRRVARAARALRWARAAAGRRAKKARRVEGAGSLGPSLSDTHQNAWVRVGGGPWAGLQHLRRRLADGDLGGTQDGEAELLHLQRGCHFVR